MVSFPGIKPLVSTFEQVSKKAAKEAEPCFLQLEHGAPKLIQKQSDALDLRELNDLAQGIFKHHCPSLEDQDSLANGFEQLLERKWYRQSDNNTAKEADRGRQILAKMRLRAMLIRRQGLSVPIKCGSIQFKVPITGAVDLILGEAQTDPAITAHLADVTQEELKLALDLHRLKGRFSRDSDEHSELRDLARQVLSGSADLSSVKNRIKKTEENTSTPRAVRFKVLASVAGEKDPVVVCLEDRAQKKPKDHVYRRGEEQGASISEQLARRASSSNRKSM